MRYIFGLDEAQLRDWSALSVVKTELDTSIKRNVYSLVAFNRKQGLPYNQIVDWTITALEKPVFRGGTNQPPVLVMDATGVGIAIKDMFVQRGVKNLQAVTITSGNGFSMDELKTVHLGKARLIGTFLSVYDSGRLLVNPNHPMWPQLEKEMLSFRAEMSTQGHAKFEAQQGEHDDILFSLALAVWYGEIEQPAPTVLTFSTTPMVRPYSTTPDAF